MPNVDSTATAQTQSSERWLRSAETLAIGACGGLPLGLSGLPAGYLTGAMVAVAIASLAGRTLRLPTTFAHLLSALIGTTLGSAVSPNMVHGLGVYSVSFVILALGTAAATLGSTLYLRFVHKWDAVSALLGGTPGSLTQMVVLAVETKSDAIGVSIAQTVRVMLVIMLLPVVLAFFGYSFGTGTAVARPVASLSSLALLLPASLLTAYVFAKLHFPAAWLFGSMVGSGLLHGFGVIDGGFPQTVVNMTTVCLGSIAGTRFRGLDLRTFIGYLGASVGALVVSVVIVTGFILLDVAVAGARMQDTAMAFAPGAMDVMMVVALSMHLDPLFVGAHHFLRFLVVALTVPFFVRALAPKADPLPDDELPESEI